VRIEGFVFLFFVVFMEVVALVYGIWSNEWVGTLALMLTGFMTGLIAFYLLFTSRRIGPRPEDRKNAEIADADPDYGFYSPHSWWPLPVAFSAATIAVGLVFAAWLVVFGVMILVLSVSGLVFEYYRGDHGI